MKRWIKSVKGKPKQVEAKSCGVPGLFLNKDPGCPGRGWVITHRASGLRLGDWYFKKAAYARQVAQRLTEDHDINWKIKDPDKFVKKHFGINQWMEKIIQEELSPDQYVSKL